MASTKCAVCGSRSFDLKHTKVSNSAFKLNFVQCSSCGAAVGVQEFENIGALLDNQKRVIAAIAKKVGVSPLDF